MNFFYALLLGLIQGLTEFLPISSTAHLTLAGKLLGLVESGTPEAWTAFIAVIQLGTVTAVIVYFWKDLVRMVIATWSLLTTGGYRKPFKEWPLDARLAAAIVVGSVPVALVGFTARHIIEGALTKSIPVITGSLVVLAAILWLAEKIAAHKRTLDQLTLLDGFLIGIAQTMALVPGSSRSGTTITGGLLLGLTREGAARFSFLLSIPAVVGSGFFELAEIYKMGNAGAHLFTFGTDSLVIATLVAGITGYAAIAWLLRYLATNTTMVFVWYRILLGLALVTLLMTHTINP